VLKKLPPYTLAIFDLMTHSSSLLGGRWRLDHWTTPPEASFLKRSWRLRKSWRLRNSGAYALVGAYGKVGAYASFKKLASWHGMSLCTLEKNGMTKRGGVISEMKQSSLHRHFRNRPSFTLVCMYVCIHKM
jgi:hypothetical protein